MPKARNKLQGMPPEESVIDVHILLEGVCRHDGSSVKTYEAGQPIELSQEQASKYRKDGKIQTVVFNWRNTVISARRTAHGVMAVPAKYFAVGAVDGIDVTARLHKTVLNDRGEDGWAERQVIDPVVIFTEDDFPGLVPKPEKNGEVLFTDGSRYKIVNLLDVNDPEIQWQAIEL